MKHSLKQTLLAFLAVTFLALALAIPTLQLKSGSGVAPANEQFSGSVAPANEQYSGSVTPANEQYSG